MRNFCFCSSEKILTKKGEITHFEIPSLWCSITLRKLWNSNGTQCWKYEKTKHLSALRKVGPFLKLSFQKTLKPCYFRAIVLFVAAGLPFVLATDCIATAFAGRNKNQETLIYSGSPGSCAGHEPTRSVYLYYERIKGRMKNGLCNIMPEHWSARCLILHLSLL